MFVVTLFQSNSRMAKIGPLIQRFAQQELRNSNAIFSLGLYLVGITYLIYFTRRPKCFRLNVEYIVVDRSILSELLIRQAEALSLKAATTSTIIKPSPDPKRPSLPNSFTTASTCFYCQQQPGHYLVCSTAIASTILVSLPWV